MPDTTRSAHNPINVAVIGYGLAGRSFHSYLVGLVPDMCLYGIAARDPAVREKIVAERHCRAFDGLESVLADRAIDLVILATPHHTHAPMAIAALNAGKHVVTDKVMCLTLVECDAMIEAAQRSGKLLSVFHNRRLDGDFLTLSQILRDGTLGDVRWIEMSWQKYGIWKRWRANRIFGGGRLMDLGSHLLDQMLLLFPSPVSGVYCRMHYDFPGIDVESHVMVTLSFENGATGIVDVGSMTRHGKPRIYAVGAKATLVKTGIDPQEAAMHAGNIDAAVEPEADYARIYNDSGHTILPTIAGRWRSYYENIADVLLRGAEPIVKLSEMRRLMAVIDAAFESASGGAIIIPKAQLNVIDRVL